MPLSTHVGSSFRIECTQRYRFPYRFTVSTWLLIMELTTVMVARGGHIKGTVVISDIALVSGVQVFKVTQDCLVRLFRLKTISKHSRSHALSQTNIFEHLQKLRDVEYIKFCVEDDVGIDPGNSVKRLVPQKDMPDIVTIAPPSYEGILAPPIKVALDRPSALLRVELTTTNIEYLLKVCSYEGSAGHVQSVEKPQQVTQKHQVKQRAEVLAPGKYVCPRLMYRASTGQKVRTKFNSNKIHD